MGKNISNEQLFEFMTKMYTDLNGRIDGIEKKMHGMENEMSGIKDEMNGIKDEMRDGFRATRQDIVRLENKVNTNHKALYDGYKQTYERMVILEDKVDKIDAKIDKHDVEIRVIRDAK